MKSKYSIIEACIPYSFLLSSYSYAPKEKKFIDQESFRVALYKDLFTDSEPHNDVATSESITETDIKHKRVKWKRTTYVICKRASKEKRKGFRYQRILALQGLLANFISKHEDSYVSRAETGCALCKVPLCVKKGYWEAFHSR